MPTTCRSTVGIRSRRRLHQVHEGVLEVGLHRECPLRVLLSEGAQSREFPRRIVDRLAAVIPNAHRQVLPDAGHVPQMTHPDEYIEMVRAFVEA